MINSFGKILSLYSSKNLNESRIAVYKTHIPAGTSVKNMVHFSQMVINDKFQMFDYGSDEENLRAYNKTTPPVYDLTRVQTPVALYWAKQDWLADPQDVQFLRENSPNKIDDYELNDWDHVDFVWAINTKDHLYDRILKLLKKH